MKANQLLGVRPFLDLLVYGLSGTGKSVRGARCPMPFIALTEPQGLPHIANTNPDADVEYIANAPEFFELMQALKAGAPVVLDNGQPAFTFRFRGTDHTCQTVVLDSATDLGERVMVWLSKEKEDETGGFSWEELDPTTEDKLDWSVWRRYGQIMGAAFHDLRSLPVHVMVITLAQEKMESLGGQRERRVLRPALHGQLRTAAPQWFSLVALAEKTERGNYVLRWDLPDPAITKRLPGMPSATVDRLDSPGITTLGSIALAVLGVEADKVPHAQGDSAVCLNVEDSTNTNPTTVPAANGSTNTNTNTNTPAQPRRRR